MYSARTGMHVQVIYSFGLLFRCCSSTSTPVFKVSTSGVLPFSFHQLNLLSLSLLVAKGVEFDLSVIYILKIHYMQRTALPSLLVFHECHAARACFCRATCQFLHPSASFQSTRSLNMAVVDVTSRFIVLKLQKDRFQSGTPLVLSTLARTFQTRWLQNPIELGHVQNDVDPIIHVVSKTKVKTGPMPCVRDTENLCQSTQPFGCRSGLGWEKFLHIIRKSAPCINTCMSI